MGLCQVALRDRGRASLGRVLCLLNLLVAVLADVILVSLLTSAPRWRRDQDLYGVRAVDSWYRLLLATSLSAGVLHLLGAKMCHDCGYWWTRHRFQSALPRWVLAVVVSAVVTIAATVVTFTTPGRLAAGLQDRLTSAMDGYRDNPRQKAFFDRLQQRSRCCGVWSYEDWLTTSWLRREDVPGRGPSYALNAAYDNMLQEDGSLLVKWAPWSCCDPEYDDICNSVYDMLPHPATKCGSLRQKSSLLQAALPSDEQLEAVRPRGAVLPPSYLTTASSTAAPDTDTQEEKPVTQEEGEGKPVVQEKKPDTKTEKKPSSKSKKPVPKSQKKPVTKPKTKTAPKPKTKPVPKPKKKTDPKPKKKPVPKKKFKWVYKDVKTPKPKKWPDVSGWLQKLADKKAQKEQSDKSHNKQAPPTKPPLFGGFGPPPKNKKRWVRELYWRGMEGWQTTTGVHEQTGSVRSAATESMAVIMNTVREADDSIGRSTTSIKIHAKDVDGAHASRGEPVAEHDRGLKNGGTIAREYFSKGGDGGIKQFFTGTTASIRGRSTPKQPSAILEIATDFSQGHVRDPESRSSNDGTVRGHVTILTANSGGTHDHVTGPTANREGTQAHLTGSNNTKHRAQSKAIDQEIDHDKIDNHVSDPEVNSDGDHDYPSSSQAINVGMNKLEVAAAGNGDEIHRHTTEAYGQDMLSTQYRLFLEIAELLNGPDFASLSKSEGDIIPFTEPELNSDITEDFKHGEVMQLISNAEKIEEEKLTLHGEDHPTERSIYNTEVNNVSPFKSGGVIYEPLGLSGVTPTPSHITPSSRDVTLASRNATSLSADKTPNPSKVTTDPSFVLPSAAVTSTPRGITRASSDVRVLPGDVRTHPSDDVGRPRPRRRAYWIVQREPDHNAPLPPDPRYGLPDGPKKNFLFTALTDFIAEYRNPRHDCDALVESGKKILAKIEALPGLAEALKARERTISDYWTLYYVVNGITTTPKPRPYANFIIRLVDEWRNQDFGYSSADEVAQRVINYFKPCMEKIRPPKSPSRDCPPPWKVQAHWYLANYNDDEYTTEVLRPVYNEMEMYLQHKGKTKTNDKTKDVVFTDFKKQRKNHERDRIDEQLKAMQKYGLEDPLEMRYDALFCRLKQEPADAFFEAGCLSAAGAQTAAVFGPLPYLLLAAALLQLLVAVLARYLQSANLSAARHGDLRLTAYGCLLGQATVLPPDATDADSTAIYTDEDELAEGGIRLAKPEVRTQGPPESAQEGEKRERKRPKKKKKRRKKGRKKGRKKRRKKGKKKGKKKRRKKKRRE